MNSIPTVLLRPGEADRIVAGHPWIYQGSILRVTAPPTDGELVQAQVHHVPWPLEDAEADIERNDLPMAIGLPLPSSQPPVLHYSRRQAVYVWPATLAHPLRAGRRIPAQAMPSV